MIANQHTTSRYYHHHQVPLFSYSRNSLCLATPSTSFLSFPHEMRPKRILPYRCDPDFDTTHSTSPNDIDSILKMPIIFRKKAVPVTWWALILRYAVPTVFFLTSPFFLDWDIAFVIIATCRPRQSYTQWDPLKLSGVKVTVGFNYFVCHLDPDNVLRLRLLIRIHLDVYHNSATLRSTANFRLSSFQGFRVLARAYSTGRIATRFLIAICKT